MAGRWPGRRYENGKVWVPASKRLGSERKVQVNKTVDLVVHSGQSLTIGFLVVTLAVRVIEKV